MSESNVCCSNDISAVELSDPRDIDKNNANNNSLFNTNNILIRSLNIDISVCVIILLFTFITFFNSNLTYHDFEMDKKKSQLFCKMIQNSQS